MYVRMYFWHTLPGHSHNGNMFVVSYISKNGTVTSVMFVYSHFFTTCYILLMYTMSAAGILVLHLIMYLQAAITKM